MASSSSSSSRNSSASSPTLQDLNDPAINSPNLEQTESFRESSPRMEAANTIGEPSVPVTSFEKNPSSFSPDSLLVSSILQELHEQNPSLTEKISEKTDVGTSKSRGDLEVETVIDDRSKTGVGENVEKGDDVDCETEGGLNVDDQELDEDEIPIAQVWSKKKRMAGTPFQQKLRRIATGKDKPQTRSSSRIIMKEALIANKIQTYQNKRKRKHVVLGVKNQEENVVDVSSKSSEEEIVKPPEKKRKRAVSKIKRSCVKSSTQERGKKSSTQEKVAKSTTQERDDIREEEVGKSDVPETDEPDLAFEEAPGPSKELTKEERAKILRTQKVLSGRVIDPEFADRPGMTDLVDAIEMQGWTHLFLEWPVPTLHEKEVKDFYCNLRINDDGSMDTVVNDHRIHLTEFILSKILKVNRVGVKSVTKQLVPSDFIQEIVKGSTQKKTNVPKKFMKGTFQLFFEFVNKVLLPRSEKRTVATASDLFLMEKLSHLDEINLAGIMMEHIKKIVTKRDGKHGLAYGYLLGKIMEHNQIPLGVGIKGTIKQAFSLHTLNECECIEEREGKNRKSQTSALLEVQEQLRHELLGLSEIIQQKDIEIAKLKAGMGQTSEAGPSTSPELAALQKENEMLKAENASLLVQVDELKDKLIKSHESSAASMAILLQNLTPKS